MKVVDLKLPMVQFVELQENKKKNVSLEEYHKIRNLIRGTYYSIVDTYTLDSQRRIVIPKINNAVEYITLLGIAKLIISVNNLPPKYS